MYAREYTGCEVIPMDVSNIESVRDAFLSVKPNIRISSLFGFAQATLYVYF